MARAADIQLTIDDFQAVADRTPYLADLKPSGRYYMEDLHRAGGIPALLRYLLAHTDIIDGTQLTVTGRTLAENVADAPELAFGTAPGAQDVVRPLTDPIKRTGHIAILRGNLAPGTAVAKITGAEGLRFEGTAVCFVTLDGSIPRSRRARSDREWCSSLGIRAPGAPLVCQRYASSLCCPCVRQCAEMLRLPVDAR
jgi:dihydroxy-acid dehydratase